MTTPADVTIPETAASTAEAIEPEEITPVRSSALVRQVEEIPDGSGSIAAFASLSNFRAAQSMALSLASSSLVPAAYRGRPNIGNCLIAMELASRVGASVLMVMQNLHVIEGKPGWSSAFLIASINSCGRFTPLRFEFRGQEETDSWKCRAIARDKASGDVLEGEWITWKMVKAEGWLGRRGSKWQTMPGQMFRYRAAAFWSRVYAPEISLGMHTAEELSDISTNGNGTQSAGAEELNAALGIATEQGRTGGETSARGGSTAPAAVPALLPDCDKKCRVENGHVLHSPDCKHFADEG